MTFCKKTKIRQTGTPGVAKRAVRGESFLRDGEEGKGGRKKKRSSSRGRLKAFSKPGQTSHDDIYPGPWRYGLYTCMSSRWVTLGMVALVAKRTGTSIAEAQQLSPEVGGGKVWRRLYRNRVWQFCVHVTSSKRRPLLAHSCEGDPIGLNLMPSPPLQPTRIRSGKAPPCASFAGQKEPPCWHPR